MVSRLQGGELRRARWFKLGEKCGRAQGELIGFLCGVIAVIVYYMIGG